MSILPGADIIVEILNGNEKVISTVYKKVYHHLENYGKTVNASSYNVKESVQNAFETFYRQILGKKKLKLTCTVETYIISIARHILLKNEQAKGNYILPQADYDIVEEINEHDDFETKIEERKRKLFISEFKKLDFESRRILTLTMEGKSTSEIKEIMNYNSNDHVRIKKQRSKLLLTENIKNNPAYEKLRDANPENFEFLIQ